MKWAPQGRPFPSIVGSPIFATSAVAKLKRKVAGSGGMRIERRAESLYYFSKNSRCLASVHVQVNAGITRRMKASNSGTVKPVSPWDGL